MCCVNVVKIFPLGCEKLSGMAAIIYAVKKLGNASSRGRGNIAVTGGVRPQSRFSTPSSFPAFAPRRRAEMVRPIGRFPAGPPVGFADLPWASCPVDW